MKKLVVVIFLCLVSLRLEAVDLWQFPEGAERYSLFLDARSFALSFKDGFAFSYPEITLDFLPFPLPFFAGAYFRLPDPNLKRFGLRAGYHVNLNSEYTDLYVLYAFDFGFTRNALLEEYGDEKQDVHWYDFRVGVRRLFGKFFCLVLETDFKSRGITVGVSLKLN